MIQEPTAHPVFIFALAMVIFLIAPLVMSRLRVPGIIGILVAGMVIGPNGFGLLERNETIVILGTVGLLYIIFVAGLEIDLDGFKKYRRRSVVFGLMSFFIPFVFGLCAGLLLGYPVGSSILLASLLGSHTLLGYPAASRLGIAKNRAVTTSVGGTILTDTLAMLVLAVVAGSVQGELTLMFWGQLIVSLATFSVLVIFGVPFLSKRFFRRISGGGSLDYVFVMSVMFICAFLAVLAGVEPIIGAFLAGLALNRMILENGALMNRIKFVGNALFIPFFLLSVGMLMDFRVLIENPSSLVLAGAVVAFVNAGKWLAAAAAARLYSYSASEREVMFGLTIPQAAATLAATLVGYDLGLFDVAVVNGVILMILVTCITGPLVTEHFGRKLAYAEENEPVRADQVPERILIPMANPYTMDHLLELAIILRNPLSTEPLYPMTVVEGGKENREQNIARAEKMLGHAVVYAAAADVPVHPLTRAGGNAAKRISYAMTDNRISMVVAGWDGEQSRHGGMFGNVLDDVIDTTDRQVLVSKLSHPLNLTKRIVVVIPKGFDHMSGSDEAFRTLKKLASRTSATLLVISVGEGAEKYTGILDSIKPSISVESGEAADWSDLREQFYDTFDETDLLVILSARRGTVSWHYQLERLPVYIQKTRIVSFIVLFPEEAAVDDRGTKATIVSRD
ncbi:cation:proton antiporter [Alteribacter natronophilus]|uniref:cation:proton antiporter n=1 Tax=Alteribacter natronophilus TaxID=2583810 RepID=UPI00110EE6F5|nr:cation:proton antiporter [Alteribacter natronophilus]TMW72943.1 cation:proton antiporter [Alteribacter natronophilus]